jgi:hypothetical protein
MGATGGRVRLASSGLRRPARAVVWAEKFEGERDCVRCVNNHRRNVEETTHRWNDINIIAAYRGPSTTAGVAPYAGRSEPTTRVMRRRAPISILLGRWMRHLRLYAWCSHRLYGGRAHGWRRRRPHGRCGRRPNWRRGWRSNGHTGWTYGHARRASAGRTRARRTRARRTCTWRTGAGWARARRTHGRRGLRIRHRVRHALSFLVHRLHNALGLEGGVAVGRACLHNDAQLALADAPSGPSKRRAPAAVCLRWTDKIELGECCAVTFERGASAPPALSVALGPGGGSRRYPIGSPWWRRSI